MYQVNELGQIIASRRRELGMTQEQLATLLHITPQAVSKWESGAGLPDLAMLPQIAEALSLSPNVLLGGETEPQPAEAQPDVPQTYQGLPLVYADESYAIFANKEPETKDGIVLMKDGEVLFRDGSRANLETETVTNAGKGEVRMVKRTLMRAVRDFICGRNDEDGDVPGEPYCRTCETVHSIDFTSGYSCRVLIEPATDGVTRVEANGSQRFLSLLEVSEAAGTLRVNVRSINGGSHSGEGNLLKILCGFSRGEQLRVAISGSSNVTVSPSFVDGTIAISGSGDVSASEFDRCDARISGSGDIDLQQVTERFNISIAGSGNVTCGDSGELSARIAGSGDITCRAVAGASVSISGSGGFSCDGISGDAGITIAGSGDVNLGGGTLESLQAKLSGSGSLNARNVTVGDAELKGDGSGSITIGRITGRSVERLSKNYRLAVLHRGMD
ncbi:MAG: DUF2807 domain-containing protein [Oscillospiraceae bacterium]|nr:DUF2807 domain-containing protein [Oscillospiraceae bacterium]